MRRVLVTGATGHLGYTLVSLLKQHGYRVRAGVRNPADSRRVRHLRQLGVEICRADLLDAESLAAAVDNMEGVFQVAAVVSFWSKHPQAEIVDPTVRGSLNVLRAARRAGVGRVVFTSSIAAVGLESPEERPLTEDDWNEAPTLPYVSAKTKAEQAAWNFARQEGLDLVVINPASILGPNFFRHTPVTRQVEMILKGTLPGAVPVGTSYVDVRDVAWAHLLAYNHPKAAGRYLVSGPDFVSCSELIRCIQRADPNTKAKPEELAPWQIKLGLSLDWLAHVILRRPRELTPELLEEFSNKRMVYSAEKARRELGWSPISFQTTVNDTVAWIRQHFA